MGESYLAFRAALDAYDPEYGVDFLGYMSQRLYWALEHRARHQRDGQVVRLDAPQAERVDREEDRALSRVLARDVLTTLDPGDADFLTLHASGHTGRELAAGVGISPAAARKRLERLRRRVRETVPEP